MCRRKAMNNDVTKQDIERASGSTTYKHDTHRYFPDLSLALFALARSFENIARVELAKLKLEYPLAEIDLGYDDESNV